MFVVKLDKTFHSAIILTNFLSLEGKQSMVASPNFYLYGQMIRVLSMDNGTLLQLQMMMRGLI